MARTATFTVSNFWISVTGCPLKLIDATCSKLDPRAEFDPAFRAGTWNGVHQLNIGRRVPVGFGRRMKTALRQAGYKVRTVVDESDVKPETVPPDEIDPGMLDDIELRPMQCEGVAALLSRRCGQASYATASGKTAMIAALAKSFWDAHEWRTLVLTELAGVAGKNYNELQRFIGEHVAVGRLGSGHKPKKSDVVVSASARSFLDCGPRWNDKLNRESPANPVVRAILRRFDVLIYDESHHAGSPTWTRIAQESAAKRFYGFSGTTETNREVRDWKAESVVGPVVVRRTAKQNIDAGYIKKVKIVMVHSPGASHTLPKLSSRPIRAGGSKWATVKAVGVATSRSYNAALIDIVEKLVFYRRRVLLLCLQMDQFDLLAKIMRTREIEFAAIRGDVPPAKRHTLKQPFENGEVDVLLASKVFDEGEDLIAVDAVVPGDPQKAVVATLQRLGRGLRRIEGGPSDCWLVHPWQTSHRYFVDHGMEAFQTYVKEGHPVYISTLWKKRPDGLLAKSVLPFKQWDTLQLASIKDAEKLVSAHRKAHSISKRI